MRSRVPQCSRSSMCAAPDKQVTRTMSNCRIACSTICSAAWAPVSSGPSAWPAACPRSRLANASEAAARPGACAGPLAAVPGPPLALPASPSAAGWPAMSLNAPGGGAGSRGRCIRAQQAACRLVY